MALQTSGRGVQSIEVSMYCMYKCFWYKAYSNKDFRFPRKIEKRKTETLSKQENCSKHQQSQIASLKARYNSIGISVINQKIKRQTNISRAKLYLWRLGICICIGISVINQNIKCQTDIIQWLRNKIKCLKEENKQLQKKKAETFETAVQCNTMKSYVWFKSAYW